MKEVTGSRANNFTMNNPPPNNQQLLPNNGGGVLQLGTEFKIELVKLFRGELEYNTQELRLAMRANTTLTDLTVSFLLHEPSQHDVEEFVQFLLNYIASRDHLRKLVLQGQLRYHKDPPDIYLQFLLAAAKSGTIHHLEIHNASLPPQFLVDFCRANRSVRVVEMILVCFNASSDDDALALQENHASQASNTIAIDELILDYFDLEDCPVSAAQVIREMKISSLRLGPMCDVEACRVALSASVATLEVLSATLDSPRDGDRVEVLEEMLPLMAQLRTVRLDTTSQIERERENRLRRSVDASTSIEDLQVWKSNRELLLQEGHPERKRQLRRFVANPERFPVQYVFTLMLQLEDCPTGLFQLARELPAPYVKAAARHFLEKKAKARDGDGPGNINRL